MRVTQHTTLVRSFDDEVAERGSKIEFRLLGFTRMAPAEETARRLRLEAGEEIFRLERVRHPRQHADGAGNPLHAHRARAEAQHRCALAAAHVHHSRRDGAARRAYRGVICADAASADTAAKLSIAPGTPVLVRDYVLSDAALMPLVAGTAVFTREVQIAYAADSPAS